MADCGKYILFGQWALAGSDNPTLYRSRAFDDRPTVVSVFI